MDDDDDVDEAELLALQGGKRKKEYVNEAALELKLKQLTENANPDPDKAWLETLAVTSTERLELDDAEDDLKRELAFYNQALSAVKMAQTRLEKLGVPHVRPDDYFAEMVKSDKHMLKVAAPAARVLLPVARPRAPVCTPSPPWCPMRALRASRALRAAAGEAEDGQPAARDHRTGRATEAEGEQKVREAGAARDADGARAAEEARDRRGVEAAKVAEGAGRRRFWSGAPPAPNRSDCGHHLRWRAPARRVGVPRAARARALG